MIRAICKRAGALLLAFGALGAVRAEVSVDRRGAYVQILVMAGITDDPNPVGVWLQYRPIAQSEVLNASGDSRQDGRPDLSNLPDGRPVAVWAYNAGTDHDVALAEWTGTAWGPVEFLTVSGANDLDPRIFVEPDGAVHVVWWTEGPPTRVFLLTRPAATSLWEGPIEVISGARRPSVAVLDDVLRVSYERDSAVPGMVQDVVVARREPGGGFATDFVESTTRFDRLDPVLHVAHDRLWLDWKQDNQRFGFSEYEQSDWGEVGEPAWPEPSWVCVEETRKTIRNQVFGN